MEMAGPTFGVQTDDKGCVGGSDEMTGVHQRALAPAEGLRPTSCVNATAPAPAFMPGGIRCINAGYPVGPCPPF